MKINTIIIKLSNLCGNDNGNNFVVDYCNGSNLYYCKDDNGTEIRYTRDELKKLVDINEVDETLEKLSNMNSSKVFTEDGLNFIDESELKKLGEYANDYYQVEYIVEEV